MLSKASQTVLLSSYHDDRIKDTSSKIHQDAHGQRHTGEESDGTHGKVVSGPNTVTLLYSHSIRYKAFGTPSKLRALNDLEIKANKVTDKEDRKAFLAAVRKAGYARVSSDHLTPGPSGAARPSDAPRFANNKEVSFMVHM